LVLALGDTAEFIRLQDQWRLIGGTVALRYAGIMAGESFTTRPQFDSSKALATTEFVQRSSGSLAGYVNYSANTTLTAADVGKYVYASASVMTLTLPDAALLPAGSRLYIQAGASTVCTVKSINGNVSGPNGNPSGSPNVVLGSGVAAEFIAWGAGWLSVGGSGLASLAAGGFQKMPSGLIIQWGFGTAGSSGTTIINTYPIAFTKAIYSLVSQHIGAEPTVNIISDNAFIYSLTQFGLRSTYSTNVAAMWIAIGQ
jgi:hypothetical protein